ncbi:MAG: NifB/NifX family molybdenum-iron cluster-binding protein [Methanosarcina sp.]|nr:NifB/NifX family molybdenum-iron cluster-binding protein [Methanosarcina sp.]MDD4522143.1 NifB/NifX family molybdenum-iron cluster-binding protein [Methanosarcina sp.]
MKICITASGKGLDSEVDPRFGRCSYFIIYDLETRSVESISNAGLTASGGAGIKAAELIANSGISVLITGSVGPNAFSIFTEFGIDVQVGAKGTVQEAIRQYEAGELQSIRGPNSAPGMRKGDGMGRGMKGNGMGRGMKGNGMGRGMKGNGMGRGMKGNGMGRGMKGSGMGREMKGSGMGRGMKGSGMGRGMKGSGMGRGMKGSGMGRGMKGSGVGREITD